MRQCCFIGCDKNAEFEIFDNNERRPEVSATDACEAHVGTLLGSIPPTDPIGPWAIYSIGQPK